MAIILLVLGIIYAFRQVMRLYPEVRWVNAFRISDPDDRPFSSLSFWRPVATLRDRTGTLSLSTSPSVRSWTISARGLMEARDTGVDFSSGCSCS